ncbi:AMP-binding protein [Streptomyces paludis]|uniref:NAD-dependent epimerase/dehydratase family protein n=1 Tax=Streptomyces paludis TaxID=2282738 RepID=A0A345HQN9_9ACTN|nr:AMP-binding protein [Streptomyces paludis]AXG79013.1 NAD-dependent epimerase/dehydratase family protein [Streptomyces paludis]
MTQPNLTLPDLLIRNALAHPGRPALGDGTRTLDHRALDTVTRRVAARLAALGTGRGDRVALLGARDARVCAALHGILRSGAAVVPVDPGWSPDDVRRRLDAVEVRRVLSTTPGMRAPAPYRTEFVDIDALAAGTGSGTGSGIGTADVRAALRAEPPKDVPAWAPDDLAYLSFTSGSSGEPKAVAVTHANAVHYAFALRDRLGFTDADAAPRVAHVTTLAADLGHTAWLLALATAGSVHVVTDDRTRDPEAFWASLYDAGVTVLKTTPSHLTALLAGRPPDGAALDTVILGGEALPRSLAASLLRDGVAARVANHYGPTETTVGAACFLASDLAQLPADEATVPIGTALGDVRLRLAPGAEEGELHIGGAGVSAGYFGRPSETAHRFVPYEGRREYRTGDVCRRRPDGDLVYVGRSDRQAKIRGFRVDPVEIEHLIEKFPGVRQCAVIVRATPSGSQLVAAVRLAEPSDEGEGEEAREETLAALRSYLRDRLPGHSVPQPLLALPDFPYGANGKLDRARLSDTVSGLIRSRARTAHHPPAAPPGSATAALALTIAQLWADALGLPLVDQHADVLELGGESILAMRTIAALRRLGHRVAFEDFYEHPTPALLAAAATASPHRLPRLPRPRSDTTAPGRLAPAQRWLFRQPLDAPRHWNQSVLLRCRVRVDAAALAAAARAVLHRHTALRRPLGPDGPGEIRPADDLDAVSHSRLPANGRGGALSEAIGALCTELHRSLDPAAGRLLRVHLFSGADSGHDDRLALIAHHLVIDGLSWRILLDDLAAAYRAALSGQPPALPPTADFYAWAAALPPTGTTNTTGATAHSAVAPRLPVDDAAGRTEPAALTWCLDEQATGRLVARHGRAQRLEAVLLAAYADATLAWSGQRRLGLEVETHGRATETEGDHHDHRDHGDDRDDRDDNSDTVGWFTAVKWLTLRTAEAEGAPRVSRADVEDLVRRAPQLPMDAEGPRPEAAFNFLGTFRLPDEPSLGWSVADEQAGAARCTDGDTLYRLRLTARIVDGRLVTDLVYAWPRLSHRTAERICAAFARAVAAAADVAVPPHARAVVSPSGQLLHRGTTEAARGGRYVVREPAPPVLLTGATGYLGRHLLAELLARGARVTCLVRGRSDAEAARRLTEAGTAAGTEAGAEAVVGDITREGLGLSPAGLARARTARVVVHAAADVRLVGSPAELERTNNAAVRRLLDWIDLHTPGARLHHISTLAVAGGVAGPVRRFSEADLRIGQSFRTPYEKAKFRAEETVRAWAASGRQAYIHRSGHIAAHSRTGEFQQNIADNRIYQTVRGYVLAGAAPSRPATTFAFSHVDTVAAGIAAIADCPYAAPGVYHVESPHTVAHDELVGWINGHGCPVRLTDDAAFAAALARAERHHPDMARLASAWAQLGDRNVVVDSAWTHTVLDRLGVRFAEPSARWWSAALSWATGVGFLPAAVTSPNGPAPQAGSQSGPQTGPQFAAPFPHPPLTPALRLRSVQEGSVQEGKP